MRRIEQNRLYVGPPGVLVPSSMGNPGSATEPVSKLSFLARHFPFAIKRSKMLFRSKNRKNINNMSPSLEIAPLMENFDSGLDFPHR